MQFSDALGLDAHQPFAAAILDANGRIARVNEAWRTFTAFHGGRRTEWDGAHYAECLPLGSDASCRAGLVASIARLCRGEIPSFEVDFGFDVGGESRTIRIIGARSGADESFAAISHIDVSNFAHAASVAGREAKTYQLAIEHAPIGKVLVALDGRFLQVNRAVCEFWGYSESELLSQSLQSMTHPDDLAMSLEYLGDLQAGRTKSYEVEKRYVRKDGSTVWALVSGTLVWDDRGVPLYFIAQVQDIHTRKTAEAKLRESEERLQFALRSAELGTWDWDVCSGAVIYDERWASMLGLDVASLDTTFGTWESLVHPDDIGPAIAALRDCVAFRATVYEATLRMRHVSGEWRWILSRGRVFERDADGAAMRVCGTHLDITERKRAEESIAKTTEELKRSNEELTDFAHVASHDLKEPLRGIHNYSTFLLEDYGETMDADGRAKLETLIRLSARLESFLNALLHYSRVGRGDLQFEAVDVAEQVAHAVDSLQGWLVERNACVTVDDDLPRTRGNAIHVGEVFLNLITNAVKYNDHSSRYVHVGHFFDGAGDPVYYVRDNGIGIEKKYHDEIFRIFKRLHPRDRYDGGTGAGLTIVKRIVERHQGCVWLESIPDVGSTFYVAFGPLARLGDEATAACVERRDHGGLSAYG